MTSPTGNRRINGANDPQRGAFTLIELILVMALLLIVLAVSAPALSRFFRGRNLDSEARRFLALTHYGQSRAVSEGIPMVLWIDEEKGDYGLESDPTFEETDRHAVQFTLAQDLVLEVEAGTVLKPAFTLQPTSLRSKQNEAVIRFLPDGFIGETSLQRVILREASDEQGDAAIWIGRSQNRLNYEIQTNHLERANL